MTDTIPIHEYYPKTRSRTSHSISIRKPQENLKGTLFPSTQDSSFNTPKPINKKRHLGSSQKKNDIKGIIKGSATRRLERSRLTPIGKAHETPMKRAKKNVDDFLQHEVSLIYKLIRQQTGPLGGNAAGGAIYGEITQNSFQKIINFLKENCGLNTTSLFLDIGSGLGKPNFHTAVDPGVEVSYGVELETLRWQLSLHNLRSALLKNKTIAKHPRVVFTLGDITNSKTLNPFTHVYSFDVGFPPKVMEEIAVRFNDSDAQYFTNFHGPKKMLDVYGFQVQEIGRVSTQMHGSSEGHTCYFYERAPNREKINGNNKRESCTNRFGFKLSAMNAIQDKENLDLSNGKTSTALRSIDPLFRYGFSLLLKGNDEILAWINKYFNDERRNGRTRWQKSRSEKTLDSYYIAEKTKHYRPRNLS